MGLKLLFNDVVCTMCDVVIGMTPFDISQMVFFCEECAAEVQYSTIGAGRGKWVASAPR